MTHVLIARMDNDGDVLLAGPAIRAVSARANRLTLLCGPRGLQATTLLPGIDDVLVHRAEWIDPEPGAFAPEPTYRLLGALAKRTPDEAIVLTSLHQSPLPLALILRLAGVPKIGAISDDYPGALLDVRHRVKEDIHEVERALSLAKAMGYELAPGDDGALWIERELHAPAGRRAFPPGTPYIVVHPGASVSARAWAPHRHAELVGALVADGWHVAVTGGPNERDLTARVAAGAITAGIDKANERVRELGGATDLGGLADVIASAEAIVVGNTGPAHLAAAVGTPVVSLYAPTVPAVRWRPWRVPHVLLHEDVPCAGCRARECPVPGHPCIDSLPLEVVVQAVSRLTSTPAREQQEALAA